MFPSSGRCTSLISDKIIHQQDFPPPIWIRHAGGLLLKAYVAWGALLFCLLLCLCGGQNMAVAQTEPAQPVPTVRISLGYLDGSVLVTEARDVTNPKGQAWLDVSEDAAQ